MAGAEVTGERSVALRELPFTVQLGLRAEPGSRSALALEAALGVGFPESAGAVTGDASAVHILWLGPDEFLAVDASRRQEPGDGDAVAAALDGLPGQALDLSANRTILELSGARARHVLEKGCHMDLHPRAFAVGTAVLTQVGPVPVILHRSGEQEYRLFPRASFADYTVRWLVDAMAEFAGDEVT
nr:sarcosine oxidase subunit gamma family protein [Zhihengliuella salsuginis]